MNIPYSLSKGICTIVLDTNARNTRLKTTFTNRNYLHQLIDSTVQRVLQLEIREHRQPKYQEEENINTLLYISTYHPHKTEAFNTILHNVALLKRDTKINQIL